MNKKFLIIGKGEIDCTDLVCVLIDNKFVTDRQEQVLWVTMMDFYLHFDKKIKKIVEWLPDVILYTSQLTSDKVFKINDEIMRHEPITEKKVVKAVAVGVYANGLDGSDALAIFLKAGIDYIQCYTKKQEQLLFYLKESREIIYC